MEFLWCDRTSSGIVYIQTHVVIRGLDGYFTMEDTKTPSCIYSAAHRGYRETREAFEIAI